MIKIQNRKDCRLQMKNKVFLSYNERKQQTIRIAAALFNVCCTRGQYNSTT